MVSGPAYLIKDSATGGYYRRGSAGAIVWVGTIDQATAFAVYEAAVQFTQLRGIDDRAKVVSRTHLQPEFAF